MAATGTLLQSNVCREPLSLGP